MSFSTTQEEEATMYKRTLKALLVVAALGVAFPIQAAARPNDSGGSMFNQRGTVVVHRSAPIVSEKVAGLNVPVQVQRSAPIVSEKAQGFVLSHRDTTTLTKSPIVSEKTDGLNLPTQQQPVQRVVVSSGSDFDWADAGIGAIVAFGLILAAMSVAVMVRRHHVHLAH